MTEIISLWRLQRGEVQTTANARNGSQAVNHHLIGRACLLAARPHCEEIRSKAEAVWAVLVPTSAHAVLGQHDFPRCCENSLVCWERFPHFCGAPLFSVTAILLSCSHTLTHTHGSVILPGADSRVKPAGAETLPQSASGLHDHG